MTLTRKDAASAVLGMLVIGVYVGNTHAWGFLTSNRWAAAAIGVLGFAMCSLGTRSETSRSAANVTLSVLGVVALVLLVLALVLGTQVWLGALTLVTLVLWAGATAHHATAGSAQRPHAV